MVLKSEHLEQVEFVSWFRKNYHPTHRVFAIPNGGFRNASTGMALKAEGVVKGVPDLCIPSMRLFIEMKKETGGKVSPEQQEWIDYLNSVGYKAHVCNGFKEAKELIMSFF